MDVKIRVYQDEDYENVIALWIKVHLIDQKPESREELVTTLEYNPTTFLIAVIENQVIGTILGTYDGRRGYIARLGVEPQFQHHGLGVRLANELLERFRKLGVRSVMGFVHESNRSILDYYRKYGGEVRTDIIPVTMKLISNLNID